MTDDITSDDIIKLNDNLKAGYRSNIDVFEWKYGKTCLSCKHEPQWEPTLKSTYKANNEKELYYFHGRCKIVPIFFSIEKIVLRHKVPGMIFDDRFESIDGICNKWEAK